MPQSRSKKNAAKVIPTQNKNAGGSGSTESKDREFNEALRAMEKQADANRENSSIRFDQRMRMDNPKSKKTHDAVSKVAERLEEDAYRAKGKAVQKQIKR